jgi:ABC-2 type transport system permease protein
MMTPESLDLRENNLRQIASILEKGAYFGGITALGVMVLGMISGLTGGGLFAPLSSLLLSGYSGQADSAIWAVIFLALFNMTLFLVLMVGVLAREIWGLIGVGLLITLNVGLLMGFRFLPALGFIGLAGYALYLMSRDIRAYRMNPLMMKELRERMRGMRAFVVITVYLTLMAGFITLMYLTLTQSNPTMTVTGSLGRNLFRSVIAIQLVLTALIAPSFTASAVSNEYERRTYDLLKITLLPSQSFIIGKLGSSLSYIFLLLFAAIPIQSIAFLFGGVSQTELLLTFIILIAPAVLLGTIGLYFGILLQQTVSASIRSYLIGGGLLLILPNIILGIIEVIRLVFSDWIESTLAPQVLLNYIEQFAQSINPITALIHTQELIINNQSLFFFSKSVFDGQNLIYMPLISHWLMLFMIHSILSVTFVLLAVRKLKSDDAHVLTS